MAGVLINLWPYKKNQEKLRAQKEWVFIVFIGVLTGILMVGFLSYLNLKNLAQEKKLLNLMQHENISRSHLETELKDLRQEQKNWAAQGLKLDLLLSYSRESADWALFLNNLPGFMPQNLILQSLDFDAGDSSGLKINGLINAPSTEDFPQDFSQDLAIFLADLKKEHLWSQVEITETQGARFLIQAKMDSDA